MIEVRDNGEKIVADTGLCKHYYDTWEQVYKCIAEIKRSPEEKVYVREGVRTERIKV